ncbi:MAG TPA: exo-alpha-sialidase, partial [Candidatus Hydrogenedentes bacterium]|nr:exo-alpha-sialidase [Candidatus Hydrogenedentota bacterium]
MTRWKIILGAVLLVLGAHGVQGAAQAAAVEKETDIVIYSDDRFYSAFPSVVCRPDGEL